MQWLGESASVGAVFCGRNNQWKRMKSTGLWGCWQLVTWIKGSTRQQGTAMEGGWGRRGQALAGFIPLSHSHLPRGATCFPRGTLKWVAQRLTWVAWGPRVASPAVILFWQHSALRAGSGQYVTWGLAVVSMLMAFIRNHNVKKG